MDAENKTLCLENLGYLCHKPVENEYLKKPFTFCDESFFSAPVVYLAFTRFQEIFSFLEKHEILPRIFEYRLKYIRFYEDDKLHVDLFFELISTHLAHFIHKFIYKDVNDFILIPHDRSMESIRYINVYEYKYNPKRAEALCLESFFLKNNGIIVCGRFGLIQELSRDEKFSMYGYNESHLAGIIQCLTLFNCVSISKKRGFSKTHPVKKVRFFQNIFRFVFIEKIVKRNVSLDFDFKQNKKQSRWHGWAKLYIQIYIPRHLQKLYLNSSVTILRDRVIFSCNHGKRCKNEVINFILQSFFEFFKFLVFRRCLEKICKYKVQN